MPRPQLGIGEYGEISYSARNATITARCRFRGLDGQTRQVSATGPTKPKALANLRAKIKTQKRGTDDINSDTRVGELAESWYRGKQAQGLKYRTLERTRSVLDNHVLPRMGAWRIREASTSKLDVFVQDIAEKHGPATAIIVRSTLSGIFAEAQRFDAVVANPVAATRVPKRNRTAIRALTLEDFLGMRQHAEQELRPLSRQERLERANGDIRRMGGANREQTPLDIIDFLIGTGARAAEVLGLCWSDVHLDDEVPWVMIHQQITRKKLEGLVFAPTKECDERRLALPGFAVTMLRRRQELPPNEWGAVFTNARNNLFDPSNVRSVWRDLFKDSEWEWVTQKTLRKTVATLINLELGSEIAAKQLGHASDRMTKLHYIEPSKLPSDQRSALDAFGA